MKKLFFIAVAGLFMLAGCKFFAKSSKVSKSGVKKSGLTPKKPVKTKAGAKEAKIVSKTAPEQQKKAFSRDERGFTLALKALSDVCAFVPDKADALLFASPKESREIINTMASGIPATTGIRRARRFFRRLKKIYGLINPDKISHILVVVSHGRPIVFVRGIDIDFKDRETYASGKYKFVLAKVSGIRILLGRVNISSKDHWVVIGTQDAIMKLAARDPRDSKDVCRRLKKKITDVLGPNMYRDPFNMAVGCVIPFSAAIFWDSGLGIRVLAPVKGNQKGLDGITAFVRSTKQAYSQLQAESDAGAPALYPVARMKTADQVMETLKERIRGGVFMLDARGSLVNLTMAIYRQKLFPLIGKRPGRKR